MERLTEKYNGEYLADVWDEEKDDGGLGHAIPLDQNKVSTIVQKLGEYEDLEEQGKLLKLPCAVGDTVYQHMIVGVDKSKSKAIYEVYKAKVIKFSLDSYTLCFWTETADDKKYQNEMPLSAFKKAVFLSKEEAEDALKGMEK